MIDLFLHRDLLPKEVQRIIENAEIYMDEGDGYENCRRLQAELKPHGYAFAWGLDAEPFNLHKIKEVKTKVFITVQGGVIQDIASNDPELSVVIIDYDDQNDEEPVIIDGPKPPDNCAEILHELIFEPRDKDEEHVYQTLKKLNF
jgi:hypothetical protein